MPSCSCGWLWSGTTAPGSSSITLIIAPAPKSGRPVTPATSSNAFTSSKRTKTGSAGLTRRLSRVRREAACEVPALGPLGGQRQGALVRGGGGVAPVEPAQEIGPRRVERHVAVEPLDAVDQLEAVLRPVRHRDRGRSVQLDDGRRREAQELAVERNDLRPVRRCLVGVERGD